MNAISPVVNRDTAVSALERVILQGDLSTLSPEQRVHFYNATCESIGLNPITRPFEYIRLNGREVLYAKKDCTDQLRTIRGVSVQVVDRSIADGLVVVVARATTRDGRTDEDVGAVPLGEKVVGEARANAIMRALTKAKRRVTLSICGLGFLDESELEGIPVAALAPSSAAVPEEPRFVPSAPAEASVPVIDPSNLVSASSFGLEALDDQLSQLFTPDCVRGYLDQPAVQAWLARLRRTRPEQAAEADVIISATWARVRTESRDEGVDEVPSPWVITTRTGEEVHATRADWLEAWRVKVDAIEAAPNSVAGRRAVLERMLVANADAFRTIERFGAGDAVLDATGLVAAADGRLANGADAGAALAVAAE